MEEEKNEREAAETAETGEEQPAGKKDTLEGTLYCWAQALVTAVVGVILLFTFGVRLISVNGPSMQDTLYTGDRLLVINSLLVLPAAAARSLARNVRQYHLFSVSGALACGVAGLMTSYYLGGSTGAAVTLYLALFFALATVGRKYRL